MKSIIILGAGDLGREVAWLIERINQQSNTWNVLGYIDDSLVQGEMIGDYPILGGRDIIPQYPDAYYICAVASGITREQIINDIDIRFPRITYATLIDPTVIMSDRVESGVGCIIFPGTILTIDITIGNHVIINKSCTIGHDVHMKDFVTLYPAVCLSGRTIIGSCVEMGSGSRIIQNLTIGERTIVGAGAVIVKNLPGNSTAVGVPAEVIKTRQ